MQIAILGGGRVRREGETERNPKQMCCQWRITEDKERKVLKLPEGGS